MKLSEAMLKGMKGTKKCKQTYFEGKTRCCAVGAICRTIGMKHNDDFNNVLMFENFPDLRDENVVHPVLKHSSWMFHVITDLNDNHNWSRLKIVNWLKSIGK